MVDVENLLLGLGRSKRYAHACQASWNSFVASCGKEEGFTKADVLIWLGKLKCKPSAKRQYLARVRTVLKLLDYNLALPAIKTGAPRRPIFSTKEVEALILKAKNSNDKIFVTAVALATVYGLRAIEIVGAKIEDGLLHIRTAKGGEEVFHIIPKEIRPYIYLDSLPTTQESLRQHLKPYTEQGFKIHAIRRTLVTALNQRVDDKFILAKFLRWKLPSVFGMLPVYDQSERERIDSYIFQRHPFLPLWKNQKPKTEVVKRKRGRPPKIRKRGRPAKSKLFEGKGTGEGDKRYD